MSLARKLRDYPPLMIRKVEAPKSKLSVLTLPRLHPKQEIAFSTIAQEVLYGGATRGGKSHLTRIAYTVWGRFVARLQMDIFRLHWDDVIANHMEGPNSFPELLDAWDKAGLVTVKRTEVSFDNGSLISLEHCNSDKVLLKHRGIPKHVRTFEEATQILERRLRMLRAWVTMPVEMKEKLPDQLRPLYPQLTDQQLYDFFPKIYYNTNPIGVSAGYFRRGFVKARERLSLGYAKDDDGGFLRIYVPAKVEDNPSEDAAATRRRVTGIGDAAVADALLNENWDAPAGDFIRQWNEEVNRVRAFQVPNHWFKYRGFDWGGAEPAYVAWAAVSDGEEFETMVRVMGDWVPRKLWFPRGAVIIYREWNLCNPDDPAQGIDLPNVQIAKGIVTRTLEVTSGVTLTDSLPFQKRGGILMAEEFANNGCPLTHGNTDRPNGWKRLRDYVQGQDGFPMFYVTDDCPFLCEYIPALQRHPTKPEDAQEDGEATHSCDVARLIVMTRPQIKVSAPQTLPPQYPSSKLSPTPQSILKRLQSKKDTGFGRR